MRLLSICYPTFGAGTRLHLNSRGDGIVLATDQFHVALKGLGWECDAASLIDPAGLPLAVSRMPLMDISEIDWGRYDAVWHMMRDPTQPEVMALLDKLPGHTIPTINPAANLRWHNKFRYYPILFDCGIGPRLMNKTGSLATMVHGNLVCQADGWIETNAYNNNRGDYPDRKPDRITAAFIDNASDGRRSIVRAGWAMGYPVSGFRYHSEDAAFRTGRAVRVDPYEIPEAAITPLRAAFQLMGIDVCHFDAIPVGEWLYVVDVNPFPTSNGTTLTPITERLASVIDHRFRSARRQ
jgi:hypothetical protein